MGALCKDNDLIKKCYDLSNYCFKDKKWNDRCNTAASFICKYEKILDLGAGIENFKNFIKNDIYVPVDKQRVTDRTIVADFNNNLPDIGNDFTIVCLGLLEYLSDVPKFLKEIHKYGKKLVVSYYQKPIPVSIWKNNFKYPVIIQFLKESGWLIEEMEIVGITKEIVFLCKGE